MKRTGLWVIIGAVVLVVATMGFAVGRMASAPRQTPEITVSPPSREERERRELQIAASDGKLVEATPVEGGWIVRFEREASELALQSLHEQAARFFRDLDRTGVPIEETSYTARSNVLKDVWGNTLKDVAVFRLELKGETFRRVNWDGFVPENFPRVADAYWVHEEVLRQEAGRRQQQQQGGQGAQSGAGGPGGDGQGEGSSPGGM